MNDEKEVNVVGQSRWDESYKTYQFSEYHKDALCTILERYIPESKSGGGENAFEVGIYPGRFQPLIGRKGYVLNGIDRTFKLPTLRPWLEVKFAGYVGIFDFWVEERTKNKLKKIGVKRIRSIAKFLRHSVSPAFKSIAPHGVIVASKKQ